MCHVSLAKLDDRQYELVTRRWSAASRETGKEADRRLLDAVSSTAKLWQQQ